MTIRSFYLFLAILLSCLHDTSIFPQDVEVLAQPPQISQQAQIITPEKAEEKNKHASLRSIACWIRQVDRLSERGRCDSFGRYYSSTSIMESDEAAHLFDLIQGAPLCAKQSVSIMILIGRLVCREVRNKAFDILNPSDPTQLAASMRFLADAHHSFSSFIFACIEGRCEYIAQVLHYQGSWQRRISPSPVQVCLHYDDYILEYVGNRGRTVLKKRTLPDFLGYTKKFHSCPLHAAVDCSQHETMLYLLKKGFDPAVMDHEGDTALAIAQRNPPPLSKESEEENIKRIEKDQPPYFRGLEDRKKSRLILKRFSKYSGISEGDLSPLILKHIRMARPGKNRLQPRSGFVRIFGSKISHEAIAAVALRQCPALASDFIRDAKGNTPLHAAVMADNPYLIELILAIEPGYERYYCDRFYNNSELFYTKNNDQKTPVQLALCEEKWEALSALASCYFEKKAILEEVILKNSRKGVEAILKRREGNEYCLHHDILEMILFAISKSKFDALLGILDAAYYHEPMPKQAAEQDERQSYTLIPTLLRAGSLCSALLSITGALLITESKLL